MRKELTLSASDSLRTRVVETISEREKRELRKERLKHANANETKVQQGVAPLLEEKMCKQARALSSGAGLLVNLTSAGRCTTFRASTDGQGSNKRVRLTQEITIVKLFQGKSKGKSANEVRQD